MGGPSQQSKDNAKAQAAFYKQATAEQSQVFGEDQALLKDVENVSLPLLNMGPNQFGFSEQEWSDLQSSIIQNVGEDTAKAVNATQLALRQRSGGADTLPTGASTEIEENARVLGAQEQARELSTARLTGYQVGRQNYQMALNALTGQQQMLNPSSYTTAATGAGNASTSATQLMDSERSTLLSTLLGGAIGGGLNLATKAAGNLAPGVFG